MKFIFASDSFKGSLSSSKISELLTKAAQEVFGACDCIGLPVADGGEGTVEAVVAACHGEMIEVPVHGPLMEEVTAGYGRLNEKQAIIEMAAASGLPMVPMNLRNPLLTTSYGTGELIRDALERGFRDIYIAVGGSATNDGGMGCMRALGVKFLDQEGNELSGRGEDLQQVTTIDTTGLCPKAKEAQFTIMCDVTNVLCGSQGATYTFGKQKGATAEMMECLEEGMNHYRQLLHRECGIDANEIPGSGAAGGLAAALTIFLGGIMKPGIETVLQVIHFDDYLRDASLVVTGEGRTDGQSCFGKVPMGVGLHARQAGVPAVLLSGGIGDGGEDIMNYGIHSMMVTVDGPMPLSQAIEDAENLYYHAALRMFRMITVGQEMNREPQYQ